MSPSVGLLWVESERDGIAARSDARRARSWMTRAWHSVVRPAQTWVGATGCAGRFVRRYIESSPKSRDGSVRSTEAILPRAVPSRRGGIAIGGRRGSAPDDVIEELDDLA